MPLVEAGQESGVGRWHTIRLTTLSFYEHLQIKNLSLPRLKSLRDLFDWPQSDFYRVTEAAAPYVGHFHEYLVRGGFPQTAQMESITQAQRLLREDIVDKVLKRDMTALFGVRRVLDQEHTFLYLCMHVGGLLDMADLCANLEVKRPTAQNFIELLEATHLIYGLPPFGYGKDVLRARFKILSGRHRHRSGDGAALVHAGGEAGHCQHCQHGADGRGRGHRPIRLVRPRIRESLRLEQEHLSLGWVWERIIRLLQQD